MQRPAHPGADVSAPGPDRSRTGQGRRTWLVPLGLVLLAVVPILGGSIRLLELAGDTQITPDNDHVVITNPVPIVLHIITSCTYTVLGAFQFSTGLRRRHPRWHRVAGRVLVPLGLGSAASALWMTVSYPQPAGTGDLLYGVRLFFGSAMTYGLVRGFVAIRTRDIRTHRAWMTRAYAIALGASTQIFTLGFGEAILGDAPLVHDLLMATAWVINLAIAEWVIRHDHRPRRIMRRLKAVALP